MVEAPRIVIIYQNILFAKNKKIINASGASYRKIGIDLVGYIIKKLWFVGKYIFIYLTKNKSSYVIRTHLMMYGRIVINNSIVNSKLFPFLRLELDDNNTLTWYLSQIKIFNPRCKTDIIKSNFQSCSSYQTIKDSIAMMKYDITNKHFDFESMIKHLIVGLDKNNNDIIVDFLLDQKYFPGVGNILQQEALYKCRINPTKLVSNINIDFLKCLVSALRETTADLYLLYKSSGSNNGNTILQIYHKKYCPLGHKTITKKLGFRNRRTTWCPICQT